MSDQMNTEQILKYLSTPEIKPRLGAWLEGFVDSVSRQFERKGALSPRQEQVLVENFKKFSPMALKAVANWQEEFQNSEEFQSLWADAIAYYRQNPPYYGQLIARAKTDEDFIPGKEALLKMTGNSYFKKWRHLKNKAPDFEIGDLVQVHGQPPNATFKTMAVRKIREWDASFNFYESIYPDRWWRQAKATNHMLLIQEVCDYTFTSAKGSKLYKVLDISGDAHTLYLEERMMKKAN